MKSKIEKQNMITLKLTVKELKAISSAMCDFVAEHNSKRAEDIYMELMKIEWVINNENI